MTRVWILGMALVVAIVAFGCVGAGSPTGEAPSISPESSLVPQTETSTTIDGFTPGVILKCSSPIGSLDPAQQNTTCAGQIELATAALDSRDPGHAAIKSMTMYSDGTQPEPIDVTGGAPTPTPAPTSHPGPLVIVFVFELADGSTRATGVACSGRPTGCVGVGVYPD